MSAYRDPEQYPADRSPLGPNVAPYASPRPAPAFAWGASCGVHCGTVPPEQRRSPLRHCPTCHQLARVKAAEVRP